MNKVTKWLSSPTSKVGIADILTTIAGAASGATTWLHAIPLIAFGIAIIAMPDNTVAQKDVEQLVSDAVTTAVAVKAPAVTAVVTTDKPA